MPGGQGVNDNVGFNQFIDSMRMRVVKIDLFKLQEERASLSAYPEVTKIKAHRMKVKR